MFSKHLTKLLFATVFAIAGCQADESPDRSPSSAQSADDRGTYDGNAQLNLTGGGGSPRPSRKPKPVHSAGPADPGGSPNNPGGSDPTPADPNNQATTGVSGSNPGSGPVPPSGPAVSTPPHPITTGLPALGGLPITGPVRPDKNGNSVTVVSADVLNDYMHNNPVSGGGTNPVSTATSTPYKPGTNVKIQTMMPGDKSYMVVNAGQLAAIENGTNAYGAFSATTPVADRTEARDKYALITDFKDLLNPNEKFYLVTFTYAEPTVVLSGIIGPCEDPKTGGTVLPGGLIQHWDPKWDLDPNKKRPYKIIEYTELK